MHMPYMYRRSSLHFGVVKKIFCFALLNPFGGKIVFVFFEFLTEVTTPTTRFKSKSTTFVECN